MNDVNMYQNYIFETLILPGSRRQSLMSGDFLLISIPDKDAQCRFLLFNDQGECSGSVWFKQAS